MDVQTPPPPSTSLYDYEQARRERAEQTFWQMVGTLWNRRGFIIGMTVLVAVASVVISLLLPVWYRASTRLLLPEGGGGGGALSAIVDDLAPGAASLLGGGGGDTDRYFSILTSHRVMNNVAERFDLEAVYETTESDFARPDAIEMLRDNVTFVIDDEFGFVAIEVLDQDRERAAAMANYFVEQLNEVNSALLAQNAGIYRNFMATNLAETEAALDSARQALQAFQEEHGVIDLPTQTQSFLQNVATLRTDVLRAEIQADVLERQYGENNPQARAARDAADAAARQYRGALAGAERLLPVAQDEVPQVARRYSEIMQEVLIQTEILKFVRPLYEQARFDEQREKVAVQVLDPATPPARKAKPKRSIIVILATASGFLLAVVYVLLIAWWRRQGPHLAQRIEGAARHAAS